MIKTVLILFVLVFSGGMSFAQFSLDKFWTIELGSSLSTVKQLFPNEKWEEREARNDNLWCKNNYGKSGSSRNSFLTRE